MRQLSLGEVDPHSACTAANQRQGPLRAATSQLEDIESFDPAENVQL
jgi:hypothetical protein